MGGAASKLTSGGTTTYKSIKGIREYEHENGEWGMGRRISNLVLSARGETSQEGQGWADQLVDSIASAKDLGCEWFLVFQVPSHVF